MKTVEDYEKIRKEYFIENNEFEGFTEFIQLTFHPISIKLIPKIP